MCAASVRRLLFMMFGILVGIAFAVACVWSGLFSFGIGVFCTGAGTTLLLFCVGYHAYVSYAIRKVEGAGKSDNYIMSRRFYPIKGGEYVFFDAD